MVDLSRFFSESPLPPSGGTIAGFFVGGVTLTAQSTGNLPALCRGDAPLNSFPLASARVSWD
jgi:hypothetical protein